MATLQCLFKHGWQTAKTVEDYIFCATDVFILNTAMKKVKLIRFFILSFVLQNKQGWNMRFDTENLIFD